MRISKNNNINNNKHNNNNNPDNRLTSPAKFYRPFWCTVPLQYIMGPVCLCTSYMRIQDTLSCLK